MKLPLALVLSLLVMMVWHPTQGAGSQQGQSQSSGTLVPQTGAACYRSGEQLSGAHRICYYRCPTGTAAITVSAMRPCPVTIRQ